MDDKIIGYHCQDCKFPFRRAASKNIDQCPNCGGAHVETADTVRRMLRDL